MHNPEGLSRTMLRCTETFCRRVLGVPGFRSAALLDCAPPRREDALVARLDRVARVSPYGWPAKASPISIASG
jgi:hypothetical protein